MPLITDNNRKIKMYWISIKKVLQWDSVDMLNGQNLEQLLEQKRYDLQYSVAKMFLQQEGFKEPLVLTYDIYKSHTGKNITINKHGNGHHRLAAAIDLGYKKIPYVKLKNEIFIFDVGTWIREGTLLHNDNPTPEDINTI